MRTLCVVLVCCTSLAWAICPTGLQAGFESYPAGGYIGVLNPALFSTYSNVPGGPEDVKVVDTKSSPLNGKTGTKSLYFNSTLNPGDLTYRVGNHTGGQFFIQWDMWVDSGNTAQIYMNRWITEPGRGIEYSWTSVAWPQLYWNLGTLEFSLGGIGGSVHTTPYTSDAWHTYKWLINSDSTPPVWTFFIDGVQNYALNVANEVREVGGLAAYGGLPQMSFYMDNFDSSSADPAVLASASCVDTPSTTPTPVLVVSPSRSPVNTDPVTLTVKQNSLSDGVPLSAIAAAVGVAESNVTVVSTSVSRADHHATRAASCFDTNSVTRLVTLRFTDASAAARLAALINAGDGSVRTTGLCIVSSSSASTHGLAPQSSSNTVVVNGPTEYQRIAIGLGVGLGVGLALLFALLLACFCCCLTVPLAGWRRVASAEPAAAAPAPAKTVTSTSTYTTSETYSSNFGEEAETSYY